MINTGESKNVNVILDENGKSIVLINDIRFKTRRTIDWNKVEEYLKEYIGNPRQSKGGIDMIRALEFLHMIRREN